MEEVKTTYKDFLQPRDAWDALSMKEKAEMIGVAVRNGITNLNDIRDRYNEFAEGGDTNPYTVGATVDALYISNPREEFLGKPSHHYDLTQSEEWANEHGYYPDARGHRDDRVKKPAHPSHPSRGTWNGNKFELTDIGMQNPNYTLFGLTDGGQDPQAVLTYQRGIVLPEITVTPNENYFYNSYDNIILHQKANGGKIHIKPSHRGRLTELKKRTGKTEAELYRTGGPAVRKMITFARNARKWKHGLGGNLFYNEDENLYGLGDWLKKAYNKAYDTAAAAVNKGRKIVRNLGLDKSPEQHLIETIESNRVHSNSGIGVEALLTAGKIAGIDKITRGNPNDKHYMQNIYNLIDPTNSVPQGLDFIGYMGIVGDAKSNNEYAYTRFHTNPAADAAWAKRLGLPYDTSILINNPDGSVHLSKQLESEIPTDTLEIKKKIEANKNLSKKVRGAKLTNINNAIELDTKTLEALRHTYKTGEPVEMNEFQYMSRDMFNNEEDVVSPLNLLHRYTIQYDKDNNKMNYWDIYDFNEFEDFVPGKPFKIKGSIDLNKTK